MSPKKRIIALSAAVGAAAVLFGGAAMANAAATGQAVPAITDTSTEASTESSGAATPSDTVVNDGGTNSGQSSTSDRPERGHDGRGGGRGGQHTAATADETAKVTAAVTAKDAAVTITTVQKDADGSFDALGTKDGANIKFDVSADYQTVTESQRGSGGKGGGGQHTAATADETAKVTAAVTAKDAAVTITTVQKDADGSFDALGTKAGANIKFDVSADYQTVTESQRGPGGDGMRGGKGGHEHTAATADETAKVTAAVTAKDSAVTVTSVEKDPDGSYDVIGTKAGAEIRFDVSQDLATITER